MGFRAGLNRAVLVVGFGCGLAAQASDVAKARELCDSFAEKMLERVKKDPVGWKTNPGQFRSSCLEGEKGAQLKDTPDFERLSRLHAEAQALVDAALTRRDKEREEKDQQREAQYAQEQQAREEAAEAAERKRLEERAQKTGHPWDQLVEVKGCREVRDSSHERDQSLAEQLKLLACKARLRKETIDYKRVYVQQHFAFDQRHFDALQGAMIVVSCVADGACARKTESYGGPDTEPSSVGQVAWYAHQTELLALRAALSKVEAPQDVKDGFARRFEIAQKHVLELELELDPRRRELYAELPKRAHAAYQAFTQQHADSFTRFDALQAKVEEALTSGTVGPDLTRQVQDLRADFIQKCKRTKSLDDCLSGPLARPLTDDLVRIALATKNPVLGLAEHELLELGHDASTAGRQVFFAQHEALREEVQRYEKYAAAKGKGVGESSLRASFGATAPIRTSVEAAWSLPRSESGYRELLSDLGAATYAGGVVANTAKKGLAEIRFRDQVTQWDEVDCQETNRIDRIESDGRIVYRQNCRYKRTNTERKKVAPVFVPPHEAVALKPNQYVRVVVDPKTRKGYVIAAFDSDKKEKRLQLRAMR